MNADWKDLNDVPKNEFVLLCDAGCNIRIGSLRETDTTDDKGRRVKAWRWSLTGRHMDDEYCRYTPKVWQPLPLPPKHLYERKLTIDALSKQIAALQSAE